MPRTKLLVSALAIALGGATAAHAQSFSGVFTFGDSLSDAGNIAQLQGLPVGNSFTTNPDPVYAEIVAQAFGFPGTNSLAGDSNFAFGGACARANGATFTCGLSPGSFSVTSQIGGYLAANGGRADPNALYTVFAGANDIFTATANPATAQQNTGIAAQTVVGLIGTLQNAGARTIVVFNLPDLGITPDNVGTASQAGASGLSFVFNSTFNAGLATLGDGIVPINVFGLVNELIADPSLYGFTDVTHKACGAGSSSVACGPTGSPLPFHYAPGTNQTFLFADSVHPTGAAQAMVANVVLATLAAPGNFSYAGELPLQVYNDHSSAINQQIFGMDNAARSPGESNLYGHLQYSRQEFDADANTHGLDNNLFSATFGADVRYSDMISLGAAVSFGSSNADNSGVAIDGKEVLLSGYGVLHLGSGYLDAIASGGTSNLDVDRSIVLGPTTRVERGSTSASHKALELGGGFTFGGEDLHHGPFASVTLQKVKVDGYSEDSLDSTAMYFGGFDRKSTVGRLGYQVEGTAGDFQPYARVAFARDSRNYLSSVQAGSNTMNGRFTLNGFQGPKDWVEAALGFNYSLSEKTDLSLAYRARLNDDTQHVNTIDFGVRMEF
ncbi:MAG: autotransporter domain-containing protein [Arenimonas sp.]